MTKRVFISCSGGVESTTLCLLYGKRATAIWCDTGDEEPEMYERINYIESLLTIIHDGEFKLIRIKPEVLVKGVVVNTLNDAALLWSFFPAPTSRWCTSKFKIEPIDKFLSEQGDCELMIGFNADEEPGGDRTGSFMKCTNVTYTYPLYDNGIDRAKCEELLYERGLHPNFPIYMQRGGCRKCFFKTKKELKAKCVFDPVGFSEDRLFEEKLQDKRNKYYNINMNAGCSYREIHEEVNREIALWGIDAVKEMYKEVKAHKACGAFCHR